MDAHHQALTAHGIVFRDADWGDHGAYPALPIDNDDPNFDDAMKANFMVSRASEDWVCRSLEIANDEAVSFWSGAASRRASNNLATE